MFVQTQKTPNPNSLKFLPGKKVSEVGPYEILSVGTVLKKILKLEILLKQKNPL